MAHFVLAMDTIWTPRPQEWKCRCIIPDHAVQSYKNHEPLFITFTISRYPSETLGQVLRRLRLERGLEQGELARKLRVLRNTVYEWENDRHRPSGKNMERLAKFFKISAKTLEGLKVDREKIS